MSDEPRDDIEQEESPAEEQELVQPSGAAPVPAEDVGPAQFPKGFWRRIDYLLHHPHHITESLKQDVGLWQLAGIFFLISLAMSLLYGGVMGATNLLQGSGMSIGDKCLMIVSSALKVPVLYLVTLAIVFPPVYVSNAFVGARLSIRQMLALVLWALAVTVTVLASMATVAAFFSLTSRSYSFIKLLHVGVFAYAGLAGLSCLIRTLQRLLPTGMKTTPRPLLALWLILYIFVGTQMAWVLRPFVGSPNMRFQVFRPRQGNFYESVLDSVADVFKD